MAFILYIQVTTLLCSKKLQCPDVPQDIRQLINEKVGPNDAADLADSTAEAVDMKYNDVADVEPIADLASAATYSPPAISASTPAEMEADSPAVEVAVCSPRKCKLNEYFFHGSGNESDDDLDGETRPKRPRADPSTYKN